MFWFLFGVLVVAFLYWKVVKPHKYWKELGVPSTDPFPLLGDSHIVIFKKGSFGDILYNAYNLYPKRRYMGLYQTLEPILLLRDPALIKQILVKDFDHFPNHKQLVPQENDPLWTKNVFNLTDSRWKDVRQTSSPTFTSSKMKMIFKLMMECSEQFTKHFVKNPKGEVYEMKDFFQKFATDVIATTAFGVKTDSWADTNNDFYQHGKEAINFNTFSISMRYLVFTFSSTLSKLLGLRFLGKKVTNFFMSLVQDTIKIREEKGIVRQDLLQLMMEAKSGNEARKRNGYKEEEVVEETGFATAKETYTGRSAKNLELTDVDVVASLMTFFFAGFESFATTVSFLAYELALNPDIQEKLRREVDETFKECERNLTYEALMKMKYLDMVVSETLRKWPNSVHTDRVSSKPYTIKAATPEEKDLHLPVGTYIWVPIYAIQRDPQYYPDPDRFDPERFSDENKRNIDPYTFLTFGIGPRNCMGSRYALLEMKIIMFHLLSKLELFVCDQTTIPIKKSKNGFTLSPEGGIYLKVKPRSHT